MAVGLVGEYAGAGEDEVFGEDSGVCFDDVGVFVVVPVDPVGVGFAVGFGDVEVAGVGEFVQVGAFGVDDEFV